jgi:hypothetical protein
MKTSINVAALKAVNLFASTEETRYYLNGVLLTTYPRHSMFVATNGHVMLVHRQDVAEKKPDNELLGSWIVPSAAIKAIKGDTATMSDVAGGKLLFTTSKNETIATPIDGTFPDWRRVCPGALGDGETGVVQQCNGNYIQLFTKAAELLGHGVTAPHFHGITAGSPIPVTFGVGATTFGVIMPLRSEAQAWAGIPAWASI